MLHRITLKQLMGQGFKVFRKRRERNEDLKQKQGWHS